MSAELEAQLRAVVDRDAIRQVMERYARGLDRLDTELARTCYWDDATEDHGRFVGTPDGFLRWWSERIAPLYRWTHHAILNQSCDLDGDDAHVETYFIFTGVTEATPHFMSTGRYIDHFQRRGGEWRIADRVMVVEGTFDLPDSLASAGLPPAYGPGEVDPASRDRGDVSYQRPVRPRLRKDD